MLSPNFFIEGTYSNRNLKFVNSGATTTDVIDGTLVVDVARNSRYWAPTFCGVCGVDEERNNENLVLKGTYFASTRNSGSHNLVFGYDTFNDIRLAENHQSGSDYRILGTTSLIRDVVSELDARLEHPDPVEPDRCGQPRHQLPDALAVRERSVAPDQPRHHQRRPALGQERRQGQRRQRRRQGLRVLAAAGSDVRPDRRLDRGR